MMRLFKVCIRRFKGIHEISVTLPEIDPQRPGSADFLSILGKNNVGKSTILEAIRLALPGSDIAKPSIDHFSRKDVTNGPIEVEFEFTQLSEIDRTQLGIRTHVYNDRYRIMKRWSEPNKNPVTFAFHPIVEFPSWPEQESNRAHFVEVNDDWRQAILDCEERRGIIFPFFCTLKSLENKPLNKKTINPTGNGGHWQ